MKKITRKKENSNHLMKYNKRGNKIITKWKIWGKAEIF